MTVMNRLVLVMVAFAACRPSALPPPMEGPPSDEVWLTPKQVASLRLTIEAVDEQDIDDTVVTGGKIAFDDLRIARVFSPVTGRVIHIDAQLGQKVKKGDPLVLIDSPDIGEASSDLSKAEADKIAAEHHYLRQQKLFEMHATPERELEEAEEAHRKASAEVERARQKMMLLRGSSVEKVTQGYILLSPIDGEVIAKNVTPGVEISGLYGGASPVELFTIGDLSRVWVLADLYEQDIGRAHIGTKTALRVVALPNRTFMGDVEWISGMMDPTTRSARLRVSLDNSDGALKPEMYGTVYLTVKLPRALALPRSAIFRLGDQTVTFVERGQTPKGSTIFNRTEIEVDEGEGSRWVVVTRGLMKGDRVVTAGGILLTSDHQ